METQQEKTGSWGIFVRKGSVSQGLDVYHLYHKKEIILLSKNGE